MLGAICGRGERENARERRREAHEHVTSIFGRHSRHPRPTCVVDVETGTTWDGNPYTPRDRPISHAQQGAAMDLSDRTVLITGGCSGIGLGLAEAFHNRGSTTIVCARDDKALSATVERLPRVVALPCDLAAEQQREDLAAEVLRRFPAFDVLVNNAGIQRHVDLRKGYAELKSGEDEIATNFVAVVQLTALFIEHLLSRPSAAVINVSSGLGFMPMRSTLI